MNCLADVNPYIYHYPSLAKDAGVQFMELYNTVMVPTWPFYDVYLDVEIGLWSANQTENRAFIQRFVDVAGVSGFTNVFVASFQTVSLFRVNPF